MLDLWKAAWDGLIWKAMISKAKATERELNRNPPVLLSGGDLRSFLTQYIAGAAKVLHQLAFWQLILKHATVLVRMLPMNANWSEMPISAHPFSTRFSGLSTTWGSQYLRNGL